MRRHTVLFVLTLLAGLLLAIAGFLLAAPIGAPNGPDISSPRVEFAPAIFVLGMILIFGSAVVYELVPD